MVDLASMNIFESVPAPFCEAIERVHGGNGFAPFAPYVCAFAVACARFSGHEIVELRDVDGEDTAALIVDCSGSIILGDVLNSVRGSSLIRTIRLGQTSMRVAVMVGGGRIEFACRHSSDACEIKLGWSGGWLDAKFCRQLLRSAIIVLGQVISDQSILVSQTQLATNIEEQKLLDAATIDKRFETPVPLHSIFDHWAVRLPRATAVKHGSRVTTYSELADMSLRVAGALGRAGIGPGDRVGLVLKTSTEQIAIILGILRAGAAYVPISPTAPPMKKRELLAESRASAVIADAPEVLAGFIESGTRLLSVGRVLEGGALAEIDISAGDLAYIIFTSGTTGRPKGVRVTHRHVLRMFAAAEDAIGPFQATDVWSVFHSYTFDFQVWEMWGGLLYGGTLVLVDEATRRDPHAMLDLLEHEKVTILNQTPSAFLELAGAELATAGLRQDSLRLVLLDGEALDFAQVASWLERRDGGGARLVHTYGITETTIHATWRYVDLNDASNETRNLCGRPFSDMFLLLLDSGGRPVPHGAVGEIHIGGDGVALGYLPEASGTNSAFHFHPSLCGASGQLYKTGDMGRITSAGDLEVLGRLDHQVKVRGYRVDLSEVERSLTALPDIAKAVAFKKGNALHTVVEVVSGSTLNECEVREQLAMRLLPQALPGSTTFVARLPLTINGKIDRVAAEMLADAAAPPKRARSYLSAEDRLIEIWQAVLDRQSISPNDNFFLLGGTSLDLIQLVKRVNEVFGTSMSVAIAYEFDNLAQMSLDLALPDRFAVSDSIE